MKRIYMDYAATTPVSKEVLEDMLPYFSEVYGNASSIHAAGREAKKAVDKARIQVQQALCADKPEEIIFTGGASESDNMVIMGVAERHKNKGNHIITTSVEHHAILHPCECLETKGFKVTYLPVDKFGRVTPEQVEAAITPETILISIMMANNEIGTIMPIAQIGAIAKKHKVLFHTDAVQAVGVVDIDVNAMNIDMLSLTAHKIYGPKGVGALYLRKGVALPSLIRGGAQERNLRAGTENLAGIVGLGSAIERAMLHREENNRRLTDLRNQLIDGLLEKIPKSRLNGHRTERLPNNVNLCFRYIEGEALLLTLDMKGICGSSGSACTSGSLDPSHVLLAIGLPHEIAHGSLRLSLGESTTQEDVDTVLSELPEVIAYLRAMSPLSEENDVFTQTA